MKKLVSLVLSLLLMIPLAGGVMAVDGDKPWLIYGNDPDEGDIYETYGDTYFLDKYPVKTPSKILYIKLNNTTVCNMITEAEAEGYDSLAPILTEGYFPEFEIEEMEYELMYTDWYKDRKDSFFKYGYTMSVKIYLNDSSRESVISALKTLAQRADVDIVDAFSISYNLTDVTNALKYIAGWGYEYWNGHYDYAHNNAITLLDVSCMLKVIAGWDDIVETDTPIEEDIVTSIPT